MQTLINNLKSETFWIRLVFMVLFALVVELAAPLLIILVVIQFVYRLFNDNNQTEIYEFSRSLSEFIYQIYRFLTYQTETKPFPFSDWPKHESTPLQDSHNNHSGAANGDTSH